MAKSSRDKGLRSERELRLMLAASFPEYADKLARNQNQSRFGGSDIEGLPGFSPECKFLKEFGLGECWNQTAKQAADNSNIGVLFRKVALKGWRVYVHLKDYKPEHYLHTDYYDLNYVVRISYPAYVAWARHHLGLPQLAQPQPLQP